MKKINIMLVPTLREYANSLDRKTIYEVLYSRLMYIFFSYSSLNVKNKNTNSEYYETCLDGKSRKANIFCIKNTNDLFLKSKINLTEITESICMHELEPESSLFQPEYEVIEKSNNKYKVVVTCAVNGNFKEKLFMYAPNEKTARYRAELAMRHKIVPHEIKE